MGRGSRHIEATSGARLRDRLRPRAAGTPAWIEDADRSSGERDLLLALQRASATPDPAVIAELLRVPVARDALDRNRDLFSDPIWEGALGEDLTHSLATGRLPGVSRPLRWQLDDWARVPFSGSVDDDRDLAELRELGDALIRELIVERIDQGVIRGLPTRYVSDPERARLAADWLIPVEEVDSRIAVWFDRGWDPIISALQAGGDPERVIVDMYEAMARRRDADV